jgi:hypothetical protein
MNLHNLIELNKLERNPDLYTQFKQFKQFKKSNNHQGCRKIPNSKKINAIFVRDRNDCSHSKLL